MIELRETQDAFLEAFERFEPELAKIGPGSIQRIRREAIARFAELGFPTTRLEEWKYTNVRPIAETAFEFNPRRARVQGVEDYLFESGACHRLVFFNGRLSADHCVAAAGSLQLISLQEALQTEQELLERHLARFADYGSQAFVALNTAFMADGAFVHVPKNTVLERPIHLLFVMAPDNVPAVSLPRNLILVDSNSQATIIESYVSFDGATSLTNAVTEIVTGENAVVNHTKLQLGSEHAFHVTATQSHQRRSSTTVFNTITMAGAIVRNDIHAVLDGEGAEASLNGLYVARGRQHIDNHTKIEHAKPHCPSHELYKGILDEKSSGVFNGKIIVRPDAQKTDAKQSNMNMLLSDDAVINTKPQLEIFADDVRCTHGATIGRLDDNALFYLRTRGIEEESARHLLTYAFASEIIERIPFAPLRARLEEMLFARFARGKSRETGA